MANDAGHVIHDDVVRDLKYIKERLDEVWGMTDHLLYELYGEDGPPPEYDDIYRQVVHAYETYITRGSKCIDGAYWLAIKERA